MELNQQFIGSIAAGSGLLKLDLTSLEPVTAAANIAVGEAVGYMVLQSSYNVIHSIPMASIAAAAAKGAADFRLLRKKGLEIRNVAKAVQLAKDPSSLARLLARKVSCSGCKHTHTHTHEHAHAHMHTKHST